MRVATAIADFLAKQGLRHVFGVNGGAALWLIHAVYDHPDLQFIPGTHECNSGFSADAYARMTGLGCAMGTSGPGATNLITAIASSFQDSVPTLFITGQVTTFRLGTNFGVKFYGFQETPITEMVRPITKFVAEPLEAKAVIPAFESAIQWMNHGRKGPALISIPDDLQRMEL